MTAPTGRVYPVKVLKRDLDLHRFSLAALNVVNRPDLSIVESTRAALSHRIACAERWEETRTKRLSDFDRRVTSLAILRTIGDAHRDGRAEDVRSLARSLVRITRDPA